MKVILETKGKHMNLITETSQTNKVVVFSVRESDQIGMAVEQYSHAGLSFIDVAFVVLQTHSGGERRLELYQDCIEILNFRPGRLTRRNAQFVLAFSNFRIRIDRNHQFNQVVFASDIAWLWIAIPKMLRRQRVRYYTDVSEKEFLGWLPIRLLSKTKR